MSALGGKDLSKLGMTVEEGGVSKGGFGILNFIGATVTASGAVANITVTGGGGASWTELEVDFGSAGVYDAQFTITDASITPTSKVVVVPSGKTATGRAPGDWQWDGAVFAANPGSGSATCYVTFQPGPIVGRRYIQYQVA